MAWSDGRAGGTWEVVVASRTKSIAWVTGTVSRHVSVRCSRVALRCAACYAPGSPKSLSLKQIGHESREAWFVFEGRKPGTCIGAKVVVEKLLFALDVYVTRELLLWAAIEMAHETAF